MNFLVPLALLGLLTLPVILLLHLLRNRRAQLDIPSLRLWRGLEQKKHGSMPRHIPLSLMLFLQLLIATALTLSLARPALSFILARPQQTIFVLDMTTSMTAQDAPPSPGSVENRRRFDVARRIIQTELQELNEEDTFGLISLDSRPEILLSGNGQQKTQALLALDNLVPGATGLDLPAALTLANGLIDSPMREHRIIVLTDGNYTVEAEALPAMRAPVTWYIFPSDPVGGPNQALLNVSATTWPDGQHRLFTRLINYADSPVRRTLRVSVGETVLAETIVELTPQGEAARVWTLPAQTESATVEIVEPDILSLDNRAELLLTGPTRHRVLLLSDTPDILARALEVQPGVELTIDTLELSRHDPTEYDLAVFEGLPPALTTWPRGNLLVVNPPLGHPLLPAERFARNLRPDPDTTSTLLAGVGLSGVYFDRVPQLILPDWAEADLMAGSPAQIQSPNSQFPLILHGSIHNTRLVVWAFDLAESNLPARLALPILTANTLSTLVAPSPPAVIPVGEPVLIEGNFIIETPGGQRLSPSPLAGDEPYHRFSRTKQPGLYKIYNQDNVLVAGFAVHAGSALESNLTTPLQPEQFQMTFLPELTATTPQIDFEEYWPWLAGLVLAVFMVEGWLAWRK